MFRFITLVICFCLASNYSFAQFEFLKEKAKQKVEQTVEEAIEGKEDKPNEEAQSTEEAKSSDEKESAEKSKPAKPDLKSYSKYDFVLGDKIIFFDDFEQDEIGDFPVGWYGNSGGEVKTTNLFPGKWFHMLNPEMVFGIKKNLDLGDNFILEFDVIPLHGSSDVSTDVGSFYISMYYGEDDFLDDKIYPGIEGVSVTMGEHGWDVNSYKEYAQQGRNAHAATLPLVGGEANHVIMWVQKTRLRIYFAGRKVMDLPSTILDDTRFNRFRISSWGNTGLPLVKNIKFTSSAPDVRSKLITEGKLVSHGIYFDVASDKVKPESAGTLTNIAKVLTENPTIKIKIVGHTDADGKPDANLQLSKKRAESVKEALSKVYIIDAARIQTDGKGQSEPIDANNTPEGKANNRRVEFLKL